MHKFPGYVLAMSGGGCLFSVVALTFLLYASMCIVSAASFSFIVCSWIDSGVAGPAFDGRLPRPNLPAHSSALCKVSPTTFMTPRNISKLSLASVRTFQPVSSSRVIPLVELSARGDDCAEVLAAAQRAGRERM